MFLVVVMRHLTKHLEYGSGTDFFSDNLTNAIKKNPSAYGIESSIKVIRTGKGNLSIKMSENGMTDYDVNHYILQITGAPSASGGYNYGANHHNGYISGFTPSLVINAEKDTLEISGTLITGHCESDQKYYRTTTTCTWKLWHIE